MGNKLYRSRTESMIGGVCGGLSAYLGIDSTLVRLFFVLLALGSGVGVLIYVLLWIFVPHEDEDEADAAQKPQSGTDEFAGKVRSMLEEFLSILRGPNRQVSVIIGIVLIAIGVIFLAQSLHIPWLGWLDFDIIWPLLLILGGGALIWRRMKGGESTQQEESSNSPETNPTESSEK